MSQGFRPVHHAKHTRHSNNGAKLFDKSMYFIAVGAPLMTLPQFLQIWYSHQIQGVSLSTWAAYTLFSAMWLIYGILHKDKIIILSNIPILILDAAITLGILLQ